MSADAVRLSAVFFVFDLSRRRPCPGRRASIYSTTGKPKILEISKNITTSSPSRRLRSVILFVSAAVDLATLHAALIQSRPTEFYTNRVLPLVYTPCLFRFRFRAADHSSTTTKKQKQKTTDTLRPGGGIRGIVYVHIQRVRVRTVYVGDGQKFFGRDLL